MPIVIFLVVHWYLSIFCQTFFLHRYGAHRQFTMSKRAERFFHFCTWAIQGSSYLSPRAYAILHRMHHAYSDTERDPHAPGFHRTAYGMMNATKDIYRGLRVRTLIPEARFEGNYPVWPLIDGPLSRWPVSIAWGALYTLFYVAFATSPWLFALLPIHFLMGPIQGAIVNWGGHKYGYRNFDNGDASRNTLIFDFITIGELFQNNHHKYGMAPNFAARWFEVDPTYQVIRVLAWMNVIDLGTPQKMRYPGPLTREQLRAKLIVHAGKGGQEAA